MIWSQALIFWLLLLHPAFLSTMEAELLSSVWLFLTLNRDTATPPEGLEAAPYQTQKKPLCILWNTFLGVTSVAFCALINHAVSVVTVALHCGLHRLWGEPSGQPGVRLCQSPRWPPTTINRVCCGFICLKKKTKKPFLPDWSLWRSRQQIYGDGLKHFETTKIKNSSFLDSIGPQGLLTAQKVEHLRLWGRLGIWCRHALLMLLLWMSPSLVSLLCWGEISLLLKEWINTQRSPWEGWLLQRVRGSLWRHVCVCVKYVYLNLQMCFSLKGFFVRIM